MALLALIATAAGLSVSSTPPTTVVKPPDEKFLDPVTLGLLGSAAVGVVVWATSGDGEACPTGCDFTIDTPCPGHSKYFWQEYAVDDDSACYKYCCRPCTDCSALTCENAKDDGSACFRYCCLNQQEFGPVPSPPPEGLLESVWQEGRSLQLLRYQRCVLPPHGKFCFRPGRMQRHYARLRRQTLVRQLATPGQLQATGQRRFQVLLHRAPAKRPPRAAFRLLLPMAREGSARGLSIGTDRHCQ